MSINWNESAPIYRQLRERIKAMILDEALKEGDALPSVRQVSADFQLNPITVSKAYQELVDVNLVEKRRGLGMYVNSGARLQLLASERERFIHEEWPPLKARLQRLGLDFKQLLESEATAQSGSKHS
jgi:GntR family transcriptional regulator